jgi:hypothetical protein
MTEGQLKQILKEIRSGLGSVKHADVIAAYIEGLNEDGGSMAAMYERAQAKLDKAFISVEWAAEEGLLHGLAKKTGGWCIENCGDDKVWAGDTEKALLAIFEAYDRMRKEEDEE